MVTLPTVAGGATHRPGHSLPELLVALVLLSVTLGAGSATALLGARRSAEGAARQEAVRRAAATLDSLTLLPARPGSGRYVTPTVSVAWEAVPRGEGAVVRVLVAARGVHGPLAGALEIQGLWAPPVPALPDAIGGVP